jgi:alpha-glucosidase (family GH31 glycosyl hydrolase)
MVFTPDGWVDSRKEGRSDGYLFGYGGGKFHLSNIDSAYKPAYREALQVYYEVSGKPPMLPRWALGNWWSRYYPYSADSYLELMERFKQEEVPLSVAVIDMDW